MAGDGGWGSGPGVPQHVCGPARHLQGFRAASPADTHRALYLKVLVAALSKEKCTLVMYFI